MNKITEKKKNHRKSINSFKKNFFRLLPEFIQKKIVISKFCSTIEFDNNILVKLADTKDEIIAALKILHDSYVKMGFIDESTHKIRLTKFHALPTTLIVIVKYKDEVIATSSIFPDSKLGLPIETEFNISPIREASATICEISSLAIREDFQKNGGKILTPILVFLFRLIFKNLKIESVVIVIHPNAGPFYQHILGFKKLSRKIVQYQTVNGAKGQAFYTISKETYFYLKKTFSHFPPDRNLYHLMYEKDLGSQFVFPWDEYWDGLSFILPPDLFHTLFEKIFPINEMLSSKEKATIREAYENPSHRNIVDCEEADFAMIRVYSRYVCSVNANIIMQDKNTFPGSIYNCSTGGFGLFVNFNIAPFAIGDELDFSMDLSPWETIRLRGTIRYLDHRRIGVELLNPPARWKDWIGHLQRKFFGRSPLTIESEKKAA